MFMRRKNLYAKLRNIAIKMSIARNWDALYNQDYLLISICYLLSFDSITSFPAFS